MIPGILERQGSSCYVAIALKNYAFMELVEWKEHDQGTSIICLDFYNLYKVLRKKRDEKQRGKHTQTHT